MINQYKVTGTPPLILREKRLAPGDIIDLPSQFADQHLATGAIVLAPPGARASEPPKPAEAKAAGRKASEVKAAKAAREKEAQASRKPE